MATTALTPLDLSNYLLQGRDPQPPKPISQSGDRSLEELQQIMLDYRQNEAPRLREEHALRAKEEALRLTGPMATAGRMLPQIPAEPKPLQLGEGSFGGDVFRQSMEHLRQAQPTLLTLPADIAEAGVATASGLMGFVSSTGRMMDTAIRTGAGPSAARPQDFYRNLIAEFGKGAEERTYVPGSPGGQLLTDVVMAIPHAIGAITRQVEKSLIAAGADPDTTAVIKYATDAYLVGKVMAVPGKAMNKYRAKQARFKSELDKYRETVPEGEAILPMGPETPVGAPAATPPVNLPGGQRVRSVPDSLVSAAQDLVDIVSNEPTIVEAVAKARADAGAAPPLPPTAPPMPGAPSPLPPVAPLPTAPPTLEASNINLRLPRNLQGAKPRYTGKYIVEFANDLEKAAYISAQTKPSAHDAAYVRWARDTHGIGATELREMGADIRARLKIAAQTTPEGTVQKPATLRPANLNNLPTQTTTAPPPPVVAPPTAPVELFPQIVELLRESGVEVPEARLRRMATEVQELQNIVSRDKLNLDEAAQSYAQGVYDELTAPPPAPPAPPAVVPTAAAPAIDLAPPLPPRAAEPAAGVTRAEVDAIIARRTETPSPSVPPSTPRLEVVDTTPAVKKSSRTAAKKEEILASPELAAAQAASDAVMAERLASGEPLPPLPGNRARRARAAKAKPISEAVGEANVSVVRYESVTPDSLDFRLEVSKAPRGGTAAPPSSRMGIRYTNGIADAVLVDANGLNVSTPLADIRAQVTSGKMRPEMGTALEAGLERQAAVFGVPISEAHSFTGQRLLIQAKQAAYEGKKKLLVATGKKEGVTHTEIPWETLEHEALIRQHGTLIPTQRSAETKARVVEEATAPVGPELTARIRTALDSGIDISSELPEALQHNFLAALNKRNKGIGSSTNRGIGDIINDIGEVINPSDALPKRPTFGEGERGGFARTATTPMRAAAIDRLHADVLRKKLQFKEILDQLPIPEVEKLLILQYIASKERPLPQTGIIAPEMKLNAETTGDVVYPGRVENGRNYPPKYQSEIDVLQTSREPKINRYGITTSYTAMRRGEVLDPFMTAARGADRAFQAELKETRQNMSALSRKLGSDSMERVSAYGYSLSPEGLTALKYNKQPIPGVGKEPPLTPNEMAFYNAGRTFYDAMHTRINEVNSRIGQDPIKYESNYMPLLRTFTLMERLDFGVNPLMTDARGLDMAQRNLSATPFPRAKLRTGAAYTAEFNAGALLDNYAQTALKHIHMSPLWSKINELINYPLPHPTTGEMTWRLSEQRPILHGYMDRWKNAQIEGTNLPILDKGTEAVLRTLSRNTGLTLLGGKLSNALTQVASLALTTYDLGPINTLRGLGISLKDVVSGLHGTKELFEKSNVLDSRVHEAAGNAFAAAIIGRSPKEFAKAIRQGRIGELQSAVGEPTKAFMQWGDLTSAIITGHTAKSFAERKLGYTGRQLWNFVDDTIVRTQAGSMSIDTAPIQRNVLGSTVTQFQRFTISNWNFLVDDVFGIKNSDRLLRTVPQHFIPRMVKNVGTMLIINEAFGSFFEDIVGMSSPVPTPGRDIVEGIAADDNVGQLARRLAKTGIQAVPGLNTIRYGGSILGPVIGGVMETAGEVMGVSRSRRTFKEGDTFGRGVARVLDSPVGKLTGIPGGGAIGQYVRKREEGQDVWGSIINSYVPPEERGGGGDLRKPGQGLRSIR